MTGQWIAVAIVVPLSALYAFWQLIGSTARRRAVAWLARGPWPAALRSRLARVRAAPPACGCDGCPAPDLEPPAHSIVRVHRRVRRGGAAAGRLRAVKARRAVTAHHRPTE